jgi:hypothetical protein
VSQTSNTSVQTPWDDLEYPLSVHDLKRLAWLKFKTNAEKWLMLDGPEASRLSFVAWLVFTKRLSDWTVA